MNRAEILSAIEMLAKSQGFYGRLLNNLKITKRDDPEIYEQIMTDLENQNFASVVDLVFYFEQ